MNKALQQQHDESQNKSQKWQYYQRHYQHHGYVVLPQLLDIAQISQLDQSIKLIYAQWLARNQHSRGFDQLVNMHSLSLPHYFMQHPKMRLAFFQQLSCTVLVDALKNLFDPDLYFHNTQLFFNPADPARQNYWHRDLQYSPIPDAQQQQAHSEFTSLHVRIPLLQETGIELIAHSHQHWDSDLERNVRFAMNGQEQHNDLPHSQLISLKQGDVLVFNAQMIHTRFLILLIHK
ncbi:MAG: phytanoyl-CoA dioxygenase [Moraxellaceae bacterium]|nr:MAG: phytanoyl-CoA dioxygenase [Moraxellaceae bacterium]